MRRRAFLVRMTGVALTGGGLLTTRGAQVAQQAAQAPRYIYDPVRQVMTERGLDGVYRVMTGVAR